MKKENGKPGFFQRLTGKNKEKKGSSCCNFELEEIQEENAETKKPEGNKKNSCCG
jgi:hypothetical protein